MLKGGCRCGAIRFEAMGDPKHQSLCHCRDCQKAHGAPVVGWVSFSSDGFRLTKGALSSYEGESGSIRKFCPKCGTPILYLNEQNLPGITDVPSVNLDDPDSNPPQIHIQYADRQKWWDDIGAMPTFDRFPEGNS